MGKVKGHFFDNLEFDGIDPDEGPLPGPRISTEMDEVVEEGLSYLDSLLTTGVDRTPAPDNESAVEPFMWDLIDGMTDDELDDWLDSQVGEPEYLGNRQIAFFLFSNTYQ